MQDRGQHLQGLLSAFVLRHSGPRQRSAEWLAAMVETVGGSEIASVMGQGYDDLYSVVRKKVLALRGETDFVGGTACWWGSLFQDAAAAVLGLDLGDDVVGEDICIREAPGHRNSPDGFLLVRLGRGRDGQPRLWSTDQPLTGGEVWAIALIEIKCPFTRLPKGRVPRHYVPQLWSGLAVSPASFGIFVDAVFRKCSLEQLDDGPDYDETYHGVKDVGRWAAPYAWGITGFYAPEEGPESKEAPLPAEWAPAKAGGAPDSAEPTDLGAARRAVFDAALGLLDQKRLRAVSGPPCFADGRGAALHSAASVSEEVARLRRAAPPGFRLRAVLPWKLLELELIPVRRRPNFLAEVRPLIDKVHALVQLAKDEKDPGAFLCRLKAKAAAEKRAAKNGGCASDDSEPELEARPASEAEVQELFDSMGPPPAGSTRSEGSCPSRG